MNKEYLPSIELLRKLLSYDCKTGGFIWLERQQDLFSSKGKIGQEARARVWNTRYAGKNAFSKDVRGYLKGSIYGQHVLAHRVAWAMHYGEWPKNQIDHINHIKTDNRIENLRDVEGVDNGRNFPKTSRNKSGIVGVKYNTTKKKWSAQITVNYKIINLGHHTFKRDAILARKAAERKHGFHENHGKDIPVEPSR